MGKKPQLQTSAFGLKFVDEKQAANRDEKVLPAMVNASIARDTEEGNPHPKAPQ